jgi:ribosome silencing factor RsfS/YbeB/iojap
MDVDRARELACASEEPRRYEHTLRVTEMAGQLALLNGVDADKAKIAALLHDISKDCTSPGNNLSHAGDAARLMRSAYGVEDEDILNAVRYHTTGRAGMSKLEMVIFLADTLEPTRTYDGVGRLRDLALRDLRAGTLETLKELNIYLIKNGAEPAKDSLDAIAWLEGEKRLMPNGNTAFDSGDIRNKMMRTEDAAGSAASDAAATQAAGDRPSADLDRSIALAVAVADAIDDKKGRDITILDISGQSSFADCFVNATATNVRMLSTLRDEVDKAAEARGVTARGSEGSPQSGWILIDCGDVVVNLFLPEQREKYQIEKIWSDAARVDAARFSRDAKEE